jgi:hypothetical protein
LAPQQAATNARLIRLWLDAGRQLPDERESATINEVLLAFLRYATTYYRKPDGTHTSELARLKLAFRPLRRLFGTTHADEFGPAGLRAVREEMIGLGWVRKSINLHVCRIHSVFRWAAEHGMVDVAGYSALRTVKGLQAGRSEAKEGVPVRPVLQAWR